MRRGRTCPSGNPARRHGAGREGDCEATHWLCVGCTPIGIPLMGWLASRIKSTHWIANVGALLTRIVAVLIPLALFAQGNAQ